MNSAWILAFITVYQTGSVSKAAELLFVTQPSITNRIQSLEAEIGNDLFYRTNRKMTSTQAGVTFYPYALKILEDWNKGIFSVQNLNHSYKGELSIAVFYSGIKLYSPLFIKFSEAYPDIKLNIKTTHSEDLTELVSNHIVNVGITLYGENRHLDNTVLAHDEYVLVCRPSHPLAKKKSLLLKELHDEKFVLLFSGENDYVLNRNFFNLVGLEPKIVAETDNLEFSKAFIMQQNCLSFLPKRLIQEELDHNQLVNIPIEFENKHSLLRNHYLVWLKDDIKNPILKKFIEFLVTEIDNTEKALE